MTLVLYKCRLLLPTEYFKRFGDNVHTKQGQFFLRKANIS